MLILQVGLINIRLNYWKNKLERNNKYPGIKLSVVSGGVRTFPVFIGVCYFKHLPTTKNCRGS
jgi:hypothetical protein